MEVKVEENEIKPLNEIEWAPCLKQAFIASGLCTIGFLFGLGMGAPTVIIPQIRRDANDYSIISEDMESWLSSAVEFNGVPWIIIISLLVFSIGRKPPSIIASLSALIGFTMLYWSSSLTHILVSLLIQGPLIAAHMVICFTVTPEYMSPRYRAIVTSVGTATMFWGIWVANAIGTFAHWQYIGLLGLICSIYLTVNVMYWPESPYWLAMKGRVEECATAHRWLKGTCTESERELENLLMLNVKNKSSTSMLSSTIEHTRYFFKVIRLPEVYKPLALCILSVNMFQFTGKVVCTMYSIKIIREVTSSESAAYTGMLILDGVSVLGLYGGTFLIQHLKRRRYFLSSSLCTILSLLVLTGYLCLVRFSVINENKFVSIGLMSILFLIICLGPLVVSTTLISDLIPIKSRNICTFICSMYIDIIVSVMLKFTPFVFNMFDFDGTFLLFAILCSICLGFAYKYLPETSNKTLIEISDTFKECPKASNDAKEMIPLMIVENKEK